jgi:hypothetical protein
VTRRDFALIAETIASLPGDTDQVTLAAAFALRLRTTNPRFDTLRFLDACGLAELQAAALAEAVERSKPVFA